MLGANGIVGAGLPIATGADLAVSGAMRVAPSKFAVGHAAGVADGLAARSGVSPAQVDINELRTVLRG